MSALHRSVVADPSHNLPPCRISAEIVDHKRINFAKLRDEYRVECADLIHRAYPAPSPNACANAAAKATGIPSDTFYRILRQETIDPSFPAVVAALRMSRATQDSGLKAFAILAQIVAVSQ